MSLWAARATILLATAVALGAAPQADAKTTHAHSRHGHAASVPAHGSRHARHGHLAHYAGISCVPFARAESGIVLTGNAATWWDEAQGRYGRGSAPEPGSVLNFRANAAMHLGHVAVVRDVVNARQIEIDQANWWGPGAGRGRISRAVAVVDVSPHNDWTQVRVALGHSGSFGSVYPTYGFIYAHSQDQAPTRLAASQAAPIHSAASQAEEVAEAPAGGPLSMDAPDRNLK